MSKKPFVLNVEDLNVFKKNETVDEKSLVEKKLIKEKEVSAKGVKILGGGEIKVALTVKLPVSRQAKDKIEKEGGKVE